MKIIAILGHSSSGKDCICNVISKDLDIPIITSHTTRPPRNQSEIDNRTYYFVDNEFFTKEKNNFIEQRVYHVANGEDWLYGIHKYSVQDGLNLVIIDPPGLKDIQDYFGEENIISFYIHAYDETRLKRLSERGDSQDMAEVNRRFEDDKQRFKSFIESGKYYLIDNDGKLEDAVNQMKTILNNIIKE